MALQTLLQLFVVFCVLKLSIPTYVDKGYYWKDYNWMIPSDAVPAGKDFNGQETYIGQAYMHGDGLSVVQIFPDAKEIFANSYGLKKADKTIRILCSKTPGNFSWMPTNWKTYHLNVTGLDPVIGGFNQRELHRGMLHVGKLVHHVATRIGSVEGYLDNAKMNYVHGNSLQSAEDYEVLLYNHPE